MKIMQKSERSSLEKPERETESEPEWVKRILDVYERIKRESNQAGEFKDQR